MTGEHQPTAPEISPDGILQLASGFMAAKHLFVATEIGLFAHLAADPATLDELAHRVAIPGRTTRIAVDAMVALGLIERRGERYRNTPAAAAFLSGQGPADLRPILRFWNRISYPAWLQLEAAIRTDRAPNRQGGGFSEEDQRIFSEGVGAFAAVPAAVLAASYDFSQHRRLLDLGGGTGDFLLPALRRSAHLRATVFELPGAAAVARRYLDQQPEGARIAVVAGDFLRDPLPPDHDAIILANVVHVLSPAHNRELFRRARAAATSETRLLIADFLTDPTHTQPLFAALAAGEFLVMAGEGDVYSEAELRAWLAEAGWQPLEHTALTGPTSLLVAQPR